MKFALLLLAAVAGQAPLPRIVQKDGRFALLVDGAPYLILGAQVNNSSAWPAMLPKVWPAIEYLEANTVEMPVYWEQFEPEPGRFDYTAVDMLLSQARAHHVRLVLLWFGTWKNGSQHYVPLWMKRDPQRYPRVTGANGRRVDSPSPHPAATLAADKDAFAALMRHLKASDPRRTVIMVQVENEAGTYDSVRDHSQEAQKAFDSPVPAELLAALHISQPAANWSEAFGADADEFFHAWSVARFVGQVAAAGKAEYALPLYANAALRDPLKPGPPSTYESGGPTDNVITIWKAAAPALDLLAPDIYQSDPARYLKALELYSRPDNPLFVPETGNLPAAARLFFAALGRGAIGYAPFGIDYTGFSNAPLGAPRLNEESLAPFALNYKLIGPMMREIARLNFNGKLQTAVEEKEEHSQTLEFGPWTAVVSYGVPQFGPGDDPKGNPEPVGRALVAQLTDNQFLVAGFFCRVDFRVSDAASGKQREFLRVEEGDYQGGVFKPTRIWNGDQTDWGINFSSSPQVLRVTLGTY
jgi:beta-galactosidase GanA